MRIISLDLLLGTPRLKRRVEAELAQLTRDVATMRENGHQLHEGIAKKATSLPALAIATASGFVIGKISRSQRWHDGAHKMTSSLLWQLLTPFAFNWIQAALAPDDDAK